ncbi:hypothetical protein BXZ70DRAFT_389563 [Cristinia sonorae]|uniref:F-box domain-containing protein n=1 Tax=Cristinia sonorae TaxID=1940300 RepID=A0A8K0UIH2_9AGAR|nr:hypothetical protein BXZ70DRAFT_389563 [Cristinia sonorae]
MARTKATSRHAKVKQLAKRTPNSPPLPLEVCERIIDFVALTLGSSNVRLKTLKACALTCHSWMPRSLYHIICKFDKIRTADDVALYTSLLRKYPVCAGYVREINICPDWTTGDPTWLNVLPQTLAPHVKELRRITLASSPTEGTLAFHPHFYRSLGLLRSVTELNYSFASQHSFKDLVRVVSSFPNLSVLSIGAEVFWEKTLRFSTRIKLARHHLTHINLSYGLQINVVDDITGWLCAASPTSLVSIEMWCGITESSSKLISDSPSLQSLTICANSRDLTLIDLQLNRHLRNLDLMVDGYDNDVLPSIKRLLVNSISSDFQALTLRFNLLEEPDTTFLEGLASVDAILGTSRFERLRQVTVDLPIDNTASFPGLYSRNVKVLTVDSEDGAVLFRRRHPQ